MNIFSFFIKHSAKLVVLFILVNCSGNFNYCITTDPHAYDTNSQTNSNKVNVSVYANGIDVNNPTATAPRWINSGVYVSPPSGSSAFSTESIVINVSGTITLAPAYGLSSDYAYQNYDNNYNQLYSQMEVNSANNQSNSAFYDNGGLGTFFYINSAATSSTTVTDTSGNPIAFASGQNVTISTGACGNGNTRSTNDSVNNAPTKWTWDSDWIYQDAYCAESNNSGVSAPYCKAGSVCSGTCNLRGQVGQSCSSCGPKTWRCQNLETKINFDSSPPSGWSSMPNFDYCPTDNNQNGLFCNANASKVNNATGCYQTTGYERPRSGDWCGGSNSNCGVTTSNNSPGCSFGTGNVNGTFSINSCGTIDTCWNVNGYRLYSMQGSAVCTPDCQNSNAASSGQSPIGNGTNCPTGCVHLENPNGTGYLISAQQGPLYLKIIDPNALTQSNGPSQQDVQSATNSYNQNINTNIPQAQALVTTDYNNLYGPTSPLPVIYSYQTTFESLQGTAQSYVGTINNTTDQTAFNNLTISGGPFDQITSALNNFALEVFTDGTHQYLLGPNTTDPSIPWNSSITQIQTALANFNAIIPLITTNFTPQSPQMTTTPDQVSSFVNSINSAISGITNSINSAISLNNTYTTDNNTLESYYADDVGYQNTINQANMSGKSEAVGGYRVFVRADPVQVSNGTYLKAVIAASDPNNAGIQTYDLGQMSDNLANNPTPINNAGNIWFKIEDPDGVYSNNQGNYSVVISQVSSGANSNIFQQVIDLFNNQMKAAAQSMFTNLACTTGNCNGNSFVSLVSQVLKLYMVVFGIMFLAGLIEVNHVDFFIRAVKIATVMILINPNSFNFFNTYLFNGFSTAGTFLISIATGQTYDNVFGFAEQTIAVLLLDSNTYLKILALSTQGVMGIAAFFLMLVGAINFLKAIFNAFKVYIMCFVGIAMCMAVGPIFITFILFQQTRSLFNNWITALFRFTLEPVILIIGLIILNSILLGMLQQIFNFSVCFGCAMPFTFALPGVPQLGSTSLFCIPSFVPWGVDNYGSGMPFNTFLTIPIIISFLMVSKIMELYSKTLSKQITRAIFGDGVGFGSDKHGANMQDGKSASLKTIGMDQGSRDRRSNDKAKYKEGEINRQLGQKKPGKSASPQSSGNIAGKNMGILPKVGDPKAK